MGIKKALQSEGYLFGETKRGLYQIPTNSYIGSLLDSIPDLNLIFFLRQVFLSKNKFFFTFSPNFNKI